MTQPSEKKPELDPVAGEILALLRQPDAGKSVAPTDVAHAFAKRIACPVEPLPDDWRQYMNTVRQQALFLARQGKLVILRKGKPADITKPVKGIVRYSLP